MRRVLPIFLLAVYAFAQQPLIFNRSVLNAASYMPPRLPGGAIAQGSIFSVFGARIGPATPQQVNAFPLSTTFSGVSITVTQGSTTVNAIPIYVSSGQINAIMPSNAPIGTASLRVTSPSGVTNVMTVHIAASAFGIFTATGTGLGPGILQNFITQANQPINSATIPAQPGQTIILWGTGLGPVANDAVAPTAGSLAAKVEVSVGGVPASVQYSGRTPCCSGVDQIVFQVPSNAPQGCWIPVYVRTNSSVVSNFVTMAITQDGSSCLANNSPFFTPGNWGGVISMRVSTHEDIGTRSTVDVTGDYAVPVAYHQAASAFPFNPLLSWPPAGTCTVYTVKGDLLRGDTLPGALPAGAKTLSFGAALTLSGAAGTKILQNLLPDLPMRYLGGSVSNNLFNNTLYLQPGAYQVSGAPGGDVGAFTASAAMPQPLTWTNRDQLVFVDRTQPLTVQWTGGSGSQVAVVGFGVDLPTDSTTVFGCLAPAGATSLSVPAAVLANLPATRPNPLQSKSVIYLGNAPTGSALSGVSGGGLNAGLALFENALGKTVVWQ